jgi:hypothetical protein
MLVPKAIKYSFWIENGFADSSKKPYYKKPDNLTECKDNRLSILHI